MILIATKNAGENYNKARESTVTRIYTLNYQQREMEHTGLSPYFICVPELITAQAL